jgi:hypothetical protein
MSMKARPRQAVEKIYRTLVGAARPSKPLFFASLLLHIILLVVCALILFPRDALFSAEVLTEQFELTIPELGPLPAWGPQPLREFTPPDGGTCNKAMLQFNGELNMHGNNALHLIVSAGTATKLFAKLTEQTTKHLPASVVCDSGMRYAAPKEVVIELTPDTFDGKSYALRGQVTLGSTSVGSPSTIHSLREGTLTVTAKSFPFGSGRVSESQTLMFGDSIRFFTSDRQSMPTAALLVRHDPEEDAFRVVAHVVARAADVYRPGRIRSDTISISPSTWARLQAQPLWATLGVMLTVVLSMLGTMRQQYSAEKESSK